MNLEQLDPCKPSTHTLRALQTLEIPYRLLEAEEAEAIRSCIHNKYTTSTAWPIWEHTKEDEVAIQDPDGWARIGVYVPEPVIMFFDFRDDKTMFEFQNGTDLTHTLEECPGFVFYLTNWTTSYLICFNDHDFLSGFGDAKTWEVFAGGTLFSIPED